MNNEIISYREMCDREGGAHLQRGMNFRLGLNYSVVLMSVSANSPYEDEIVDDGETLIYEGHDEPKTEACPIPKLVDQPLSLPSGKLTQNGRFFEAAKAAADGSESPERVRVYEKIKKGMWSYNGVFHLMDSWFEQDENREVIKFKLIAIEDDEDFSLPPKTDAPHRRIIPTQIKIKVWNRDKGKCVQCGAEDELHFDHVLPYSKGGTSMTAENVQLLCARHNLQKSNRFV